MILSDKEVLNLGLSFVDCRSSTRRHAKEKRLVERFKKHYGADNVTLAKQWKDLCTSTLPKAKLKKKEKTGKGFRMFMVAHNFLFCYPKNMELLANGFDLSVNAVRKMWVWIEKIAALKKTKIVWPEEDYMNPDTARLPFTVDCVDFHKREPSSHPNYNIDKSYSSYKFKKAGLRYELAIDVHTSRLIWIKGPYKCGSDNDVKIFQTGGLKDKVMQLPGKKGIADRGYEGEEEWLSMPTTLDGPLEHQYKSRARCRHESFNGKIKKYQCLSTYWEHTIAKHKLAVEAVCVTTQYQMENGSPRFDV
jgi:hypothetical protein